MSAHRTESHSNITMIVVGSLAIWLALVFVIGVRGSFVRPPGSPPLPILFGVTAPLLVLAGAFLVGARLPRFRLESRPSSCHWNSGVAIRRARISGALYLWDLARRLRLARQGRQYRHRPDRAMDGGTYSG